MNTKRGLITTGALAITGFLLLVQVGYADFAMDFREGRDSAAPNSAVPVLADFQAADPLLDATTTLVINRGLIPINGDDSANNGSSWNDYNTAIVHGDFTVLTEGGVAGFSSGADSWNDQTVISENYAFHRDAEAARTLTLSGINTTAGETLTLTTWGIGDNAGQETLFTARYSSAAEQTAETLYNGEGELRDSPVGSIPWVQFSFVSDGTDTISFDWQVIEGNSFANLNGFSLSISGDGVGLLGDFDNDGDVDLADLDQYNGNIGAAAVGPLEALDLDEDGTVDAGDFAQHYTDLVETSNGQKGTFAGDVNLDGTVNVLGDAFALVGNLNNSATSWAQGDLNADGTVNVLGDAFLLVGNLGNTNNPAGSPSASAVPEPGSLSLLAIAAVGLVSRRKRS